MSGRSYFAGLLMLLLPAAAQAQTDFGEPNTTEREAYCQAAQPACMSVGTDYCQSLPDQPPDCLDDADTQCKKALIHCMEAQAVVSAPAPQPSASTPTTTCKHLFRALRQHVHKHPDNRVSVLWTTNYAGGETRFSAWTKLQLKSFGSGAAVASGERQRSYQSGSGPEAEHVSFRLTDDERLILSWGDHFQDYDARCSANRFAVATGDRSVEMFNFFVPRSPINDDVIAEPPVERSQ